MKTLREWYHSTIWYNPRSVRSSSNQVLAVTYHRTAAITYLMYLLWGFFSAVDDNHYQDWFSYFVLFVSVLAFTGAVFFPKTGRLELFASSALVVLITFFISLTLANAINNHPGSWFTNVVLDAIFLVTPISRISFIIRQLFHEAPMGKKK